MNWPHVRAVLISLHILAIGLMAIPAPSGAHSKSAWDDPTVQDEISAWSERLERVGIDWGPEQLQDRLWTFTQTTLNVRDKVLSPFRPYYKYFGTHQGWRMFVAPHRYPSRLSIEVERNGEWERVYEQLSDTYTWKQSVFENARARSAMFRYSWRSFKRSYAQLAKWVAAEAAGDFPDATRIRLRWHKARSPTPNEVLDGEIPATKAHSTRVLDLTEYR